MPTRRIPQSYEAVFFDVDGTLVDSIRMIVRGLGDTVEKFTGSRPSESELRSIIGTPLRDQLRSYFEVEPTEDEYQQMFSYTLDRFEANVHLESDFEPAVESLKLFSQNGVKTALVTSKDHVELAGFMRRFVGVPFVNTTVCASDVTRPKPAPESAFLAMERLGVSPERTIIVGDSVFDLRCGRGAGLFTAAVLYGAGKPDALIAEEPDFIFETPESLLGWAEATCRREPCPGLKSP